MKNRWKLLITLILSTAVFFTMTACSSNKDEIIEEPKAELKTASIETESDKIEDTEEIVPSKTVKYEPLGITMEFTGDFIDCELNEAQRENIDEITPEAVDGFNIVKTFGEKQFIIATILSIPDSTLETPEYNSKFSYVYHKDNNNIAVYIPEIENTEENPNEFYDDLISMQYSIIHQLNTISFSEV